MVGLWQSLQIDFDVSEVVSDSCLHKTTKGPNKRMIYPGMERGHHVKDCVQVLQLSESALVFLSSESNKLKDCLL